MSEAIQSTDLQEYQVEDLVDDAVATGAFDAYVYSYRQGGRTIEGLSARGVEDMAKGRGISIIDYEFIDKVDPTLGEGVLCVAMAKQVIQHPATKETQPDGTVIETEAYEQEFTAPGSRFEPSKDTNGRPDPHYHQKALVKAMRNARLQLISLAARKIAIKELLKRMKSHPAPIPANTSRRTQANGQRTQRPPAENDNGQAKGQTPIEKAMKTCFDVFGEKEADLLAKGAAKKDFWDALKQVLSVKSRDDMSLVQWKQVTAALEANPYGKIVQDVIAKIKDGKAKEPTEKTSTANSEKGASPSSEGDSPSRYA